MNKIFKTKKEASDYYDKYNKNMRSLNAHNTYISDWNPVTYLLYIVRKYNGEKLTIPPFKKSDKEAIIDLGF
jgi:hypothetical protein